MGIFQRFGKEQKKEELTHEQKLDAAYRKIDAVNSRLIPGFTEMTFPGGKAQAATIIEAMSKICGVKLDNCDEGMYHNMLSAYVTTKVDMSFLHYADIDFIGNLVRRYGGLVKNRETAMKVAGLVSAMDKNPFFEMKTEADIEYVNDFVRICTDMEKQASENVGAEEENLCDEDYGLVKTKPIYTHGIGGSNEYLGALETSDGVSLSWSRRGSTPVDGVNGIVDIYDSSLPDGSEYKTLFINMYGTANSKVIPKGFRKK